MLFYGLITAVLLSFTLKKIFNTKLITQFSNLKLFLHTSAVYFIRQQNFAKQQNTSTGTRVWVKSRAIRNLNDL
jgi:hypothetical protein